MCQDANLNTMRSIARLAGVAYLILFLCGSFSIFVRMGMVVPGDAEASAANITQSEQLFRLQLVSELVMAIAWLLVAFLLHVLLRRVQRHVATLFLVLASVGVATICANTVFQAGVLLVLDGGGFVKGVDAELLHTSAGLFLALFDRGWTISGIFTGLWLLPLGYLVIRSGFFSKGAGGGAHRWRLRISDSGIVEIAFGLWLLVKGVKVPGTDPAVARESSSQGLG